MVQYLQSTYTTVNNKTVEFDWFVLNAMDLLQIGGVGECLAEFYSGSCTEGCRQVDKS